MSYPGQQLRSPVGHASACQESFSLACDVPPFTLVIPDQNLIVEPIRFGRDRRHVAGKIEKLADVLGGQKSKPRGKFTRGLERRQAADDETPFSKGRNVEVIGIRQQA